MAKKKKKLKGSKRMYSTAKLSETQIMRWAREHYRRTGKWPTRHSGPIPETNDTWKKIDRALWNGHRGLRGTSSLSQLLAKHGKSRVPKPPTIEQILRAIDRYKRQHGKYPRANAEIAFPKRGMTWSAVDSHLHRHPPKKYPEAISLIKLLELARGVRNPKNLPPLTEKLILKWARAHHRRTGNWPNKDSGEIPESPAIGETWMNVSVAMSQGQRGLSGEVSLARLLARHGYSHKPVYPDGPPPLTIEQILEWADAHHHRTGEWPAWAKGPIPEAPIERWELVAEALYQGRRGLPKGWTMRKLLARHRGYKYRVKCPDITESQIARLAQRHFRETGEWPLRRSGPVRGGYPGDTWQKLDMALWNGSRSLPGESSLARLLFNYFGVTRRSDVFVKKKRPNRQTSREGSWLDPYARRPKGYAKRKRKQQDGRD